MTIAARPSEFAPIATARRRHAVIIGSGFGGLAAAVRLGARGYRVTVLERLDQPGGRACVYRQDGFTFDAGPTIITAPFLFEQLWDLCGRKMADDVTLRQLDPFYTIRFADGSLFECSGDADAMRAEVAKLSPADLPGYERFMKLSATVYRIGFEKLGFRAFGTIADMLRVLPDLVRLSAYRSVYAIVSKHIKDERLRQALSFHPLFIGGNPFSVSSLYILISYLERNWGVHCAIGGTGQLVRGLVGLIEGQGNRVRLNAEVAAITLDGRTATGVRLASGEEIAADIVVSNADSAWTYRNLLPQSARRIWTDRKIDRAKYSMSLFVWYFGTNRKFENVPHHMILLGERYKSLLADIFHKKVLAKDFSLYLHRPTATDPSLAPDGCDAFYVLSPVPNLQSGVDWSTTAEAYRATLETYLEETLMPGLKGSIISSRLLTPQDFQDRLLSCNGAAFGMEPLLTQSAWFRPHNCSEDIRNLYLVGAGTHPGAGLPGVLTSACILEKLVPAGVVKNA